LKKHFRSIVESLKQIVEDTEPDENETFFSREEQPKPNRSNASFDNSLISISTPVKALLK